MRRGTEGHASRAAGAWPVLAWIPALLALCVAGLHGQEPDSSAVLTGTVVSAMTGGPLEGAAVSLVGARHGVHTDERGRFTLTGLEAGRDTLEVELLGFSSKRLPIDLAADRLTTVTLLLSETVLRMEEIRVTVKRDNRGKLREFYDRMERGFGYFLTPEDVERRDARSTSDLLRGVPGVSVGANDIYGAQVRITRRSVSSHCRQPRVYLDGQVAEDFRIDDLPAEDVLAVEVYRGASETPPLFKFRGATCGTLVFWTRDGRSR